MDSEDMQQIPHVSTNIFNNLLHYFKYSSSAYSLICPRPNGSHLVSSFSNPMSDVQGYVSRDDSRNEIIVATRGSVSVVDILMDAQIALVPFIAPGVTSPAGVKVHAGILMDWNTVALQVTLLVRYQLEKNPNYDIVTCGHSLGGALALIAAVALQENFPKSDVRTYSYGAPRAGNKTFAEFVNAQFGNRAHRVVHTNDGVPTIIPTSLGYHHHGIEYWQHADPATEDTMLQCSADGEDKRCSASIPTGGINVAHMMYFGMPATTPFCL